MGKFRCVCGYVIQTSGPIPNPNEWLMISSEDFDRESEGGTFDSLYERTVYSYLCPQSGHLWIFWRGLGERAECYQPLPSENDAESREKRGGFGVPQVDPG